MDSVQYKLETPQENSRLHRDAVGVPRVKTFSQDVHQKILCISFFGPLIHLMVQPDYNQEAHGNTGAWTAKLAHYKPGNEARDFFKNADLPLVFRLHLQGKTHQ